MVLFNVLFFCNIKKSYRYIFILHEFLKNVQTGSGAQKPVKFPFCENLMFLECHIERAPILSNIDGKVVQEKNSIWKKTFPTNKNSKPQDVKVPEYDTFSFKTLKKMDDYNQVLDSLSKVIEDVSVSFNQQSNKEESKDNLQIYLTEISNSIQNVFEKCGADAGEDCVIEVLE